jgi:pimeloyl-ACP methyl ester carboxylesterase
MNLLRRAVGDPQLNYLGVSYGSYLGATYANLFPGKVRAMVLDGNVDPVAYATPQRAGACPSARASGWGVMWVRRRRWHSSSTCAGNPRPPGAPTPPAVRAPPNGGSTPCCNGWQSGR